VLKKEGIELVDSTSLLAPLLAREGVLTRRQPDDEERADLEVGYAAADQIAGMDIGQTVAVKSRAIVAVEAMEGTDAVTRAADAANIAIVGRATDATRTRNQGA